MSNVVDRAQRLGITSTLTAHPSLALGTKEVSVLELTAAYIPFAKHGMSSTTHAILKIEADDGTVLYEYAAPEPTRLIEEDVAKEMTHLMYQVVYRGTGKAASLGARSAAGKTGTSQDWRDAWFVGYTSDYVTGVWVGNDDNSPTDHVVGGGLPAGIWRDVMLQAHSGMKVTQMAGAIPARDTHNLEEFQDFLEELSRDLRRIDARDRYFSRRPSDEPKKKRKIFPWD
jgi:penicillin-binding protein 1A